MIESYVVSESSVERVSMGSKKRGVKITYMYAPSSGDIEEINKNFDIDRFDLWNSLDPEEKPRMDVRHDYTLVLFRAPLEKGKATTFGVFIFKDDLLIISKNDVKEITHTLHTMKDRKFKSDKQSLLMEILDSVVKSYFKVLENIDDNMESIQNRIIRSPSPRDLQDIFFHKKKLVYLHKALMSNREVVSSMEKGFSTHIKLSTHTRALYNSIIELIDMEEIYRDIAASIIDLHVSSISNNLNKVMKTLTVVATALLVPTLISGIYGMNIDLPFQNHPSSFLIVMGMMILSMLVVWLWFKKENWT